MSNEKMIQQDRSMRRVLLVCSLLYGGTLLFSMYHNVATKNNTAFAMGVVSMVLPFLVPLMFRLFRFQPVYEIYILNVVFLYFSSLLGSALSWYSYPYFDKVTHFVSGWLFLILARIVYYHFRKSDDIRKMEDKKICYVFMNAVNMAIAVIWEFYEYALLVFFQNDAIRQYTTGVSDSMTDMLCATVAGLSLTIYIYYMDKHNKQSFVTRIYERFYEKNIARK